jgi:hypothetical protein
MTCFLRASLLVVPVVVALFGRPIPAGAQQSRSSGADTISYRQTTMQRSTLAADNPDVAEAARRMAEQTDGETVMRFGVVGAGRDTLVLIRDSASGPPVVLTRTTAGRWTPLAPPARTLYPAELIFTMPVPASVVRSGQRWTDTLRATRQTPVGVTNSFTITEFTIESDTTVGLEPVWKVSSRAVTRMGIPDHDLAVEATGGSTTEATATLYYSPRLRVVLRADVETTQRVVSTVLGNTTTLTRRSSTRLTIDGK